MSGRRKNLPLLTHAEFEMVANHLFQQLKFGQAQAAQDQRREQMEQLFPFEWPETLEQKRERERLSSIDMRDKIIESLIEPCDTLQFNININAAAKRDSEFYDLEEKGRKLFKSNFSK